MLLSFLGTLCWAPFDGEFSLGSELALLLGNVSCQQNRGFSAVTDQVNAGRETGLWLFATVDSVLSSITVCCEWLSPSTWVKVILKKYI